MNYNGIPNGAFISNIKKVIKYREETKLVMMPFNESKWHHKFPSCPNLEYSQLLMTNIGSYSIALPDTSKSLINFLLELNNLYKFKPNLCELIVTEATGGIGGYSIKLAYYFKNVNIIEISKINVDIIINNLEVYNTALTKNNLISDSIVHVYNSDYLDMIYDLNQDIIIFDMPWHGPNYKSVKNIKLGLNNINIWFIINDLYLRNKFKICVFMAPKNYDSQDLIDKIMSPNIIIKKMEKHYLIAVLNLN